MEKSTDLKAMIVSMYKSYFKTASFFRPRIAENVTIFGKLQNYTVDIYFEFIQMNNLERTVIKVIEGTEVTEKDIWEFANVLKDLRFFAKGILYYDSIASSKVKNVAKVANIDLKHFDLLNEIVKSCKNMLEVVVPDEDVIGDPFWGIMEWNQNIGEFQPFGSEGLLFLSKKQAINYCSKLQNRANVFGISQNHLQVLINLQEIKMFPELNIVYPEFEQMQENSIFYYSISHEKLKKFYLRGV